MSCKCRLVQIGRTSKKMVLPNFIDLSSGWSLTIKGYASWTSRGSRLGIRGLRAHRLVMESLSGDALSPTFHVHHMDFNKLNNCPLNLLLLDHRLHQTGYQCPWTGRFLSRREALRRGIITK